MSQARIGQTFLGIALAGMLASVAWVGCTGAGDTDGGQGNDDSGVGSQPVSNGGFGASLTIELDGGGNILHTAERTGFFVTALDPRGVPLADKQVFCETEKGIAIIEPSSNGVAFEHTGSSGTMSGVLGGVTPGSYQIECRLGEGFNLVATRHFKVEGDVPAGFAGFPGAAGGNLGGGNLVENPNPTSQAISVTFGTVGGSALTSNGPIDLVQDLDCNRDGPATLSDLEPYGFDEYHVTLSNGSAGDLIVDSVTFVVDDGRSVTSTQQKTGLVIGAGATGEIVGTFTEFVLGSGLKTFAGTSALALLGTYNVSFTVRAHSVIDGSLTFRTSASVTFGDVNYCG